jgi:hypothetical protein
MGAWRLNKKKQKIAFVFIFTSPSLHKTTHHAEEGVFIKAPQATPHSSAQ